MQEHKKALKQCSVWNITSCELSDRILSRAHPACLSSLQPTRQGQDHQSCEMWPGVRAAEASGKGHRERERAIFSCIISIPATVLKASAAVTARLRCRCDFWSRWLLRSFIHTHELMFSHSDGSSHWVNMQQCFGVCQTSFLSGTESD